MFSILQNGVVIRNLLRLLCHTEVYNLEVTILLFENVFKSDVSVCVALVVYSLDSKNYLSGIKFD